MPHAEPGSSKRENITTSGIPTNQATESFFHREINQWLFARRAPHREVTAVHPDNAVTRECHTGLIWRNGRVKKTDKLASKPCRFTTRINFPKTCKCIVARGYNPRS